MFELTTPTAATLKSVTPRTECHGEDTVVAVGGTPDLTPEQALAGALDA